MSSSSKRISTDSLKREKKKLTRKSNILFQGDVDLARLQPRVLIPKLKLKEENNPKEPLMSPVISDDEAKRLTKNGQVIPQTLAIVINGHVVIYSCK